MKILLIRPPQYVNRSYCPYYAEPPLGIGYLAQAATRGGHTVKIIDAIAEYPFQYTTIDGRPGVLRVGASDIQIAESAFTFKPDLIGISALFVTLAPSVGLLTAALKKRLPNIPIVLGGPLPSSMPNLIDDPNVDYLAIGEGEELLLELAGGNPVATILGLIYKDQNGLPQRNPRRPPVKNIDVHDWPRRDAWSSDYNQYFLEFLAQQWRKMFRFPLPRIPGRDSLLAAGFNAMYRFAAFPTISIVTSRGCPYSCSFCAIGNVWERRYRMRSAQSVLDEIDYWAVQEKIKHIQIVDDNFTLNRERTVEICQEIIRKKYRLSFAANSGLHVHHLDDEIIGLLRKVGFTKIGLGIESASERVQSEIIGKKVDLNRARDVIRSCRKHGIYVQGFFVFGFPGETEQDRSDSLSFIKTSGLNDARVYTCQPIPGSPIYEDAVRRNILADNYDPVNTLVTGSVNYFIRDAEEQRKFQQFMREARIELKRTGLFQGRIELSDESIP